ncbi:MAG: hypothetical protein GKR97_16200 [Rhizobiaceae bacterium]|nr:hypothetical protein [Rhizobiaceae bacterium]
MNIRVLISGLFLLIAMPSWAQNASVEYAEGLSPTENQRSAHQLLLDARLVADGPAIERGMVWRVFRDKADIDGKLPVIATARGGSASISLNTGTYLVHAAFGRAGASKRINISTENLAESFILQAGGLVLNAETANHVIQAKHLRFSIFERQQNEEGERKMIALNVEPNKIVQLNEGTYHVLSRYGTINATVRADLEVKAGQVTKAVLQHRGAGVSLRLVSRPGGDPIANTSWTVFTEDGDNVFSSNLVSPFLILAEGAYEAVVRNGDDNYRRTFAVRSGESAAVEVLLE